MTVTIVVPVGSSEAAMRLNIPRREPRKLRSNKTKQMIERHFICRQCRKNFVRMVPRVGKKAFHLFCSRECFRAEVRHLNTHGMEIEVNTPMHRELKRRAKRASWNPWYVYPSNDEGHYPLP